MQFKHNIKQYKIQLTNVHNYFYPTNQRVASSILLLAILIILYLIQYLYLALFTLRLII